MRSGTDSSWDSSFRMLKGKNLGDASKARRYVCLILLLTFKYFLKTATHRVNVLDGTEFELHVGIVVFVLVAFAGCSIGDSVDLVDETIR